LLQEGAHYIGQNQTVNLIFALASVLHQHFKSSCLCSKRARIIASQNKPSTELLSFNKIFLNYLFGMREPAENPATSYNARLL
jgi:hypothetical protein